ncbi:Uncharacterized protein Rs2_01977 [Raphanus sativus]|nr:Uncharacterized protein Rs2_01977 [Raphanus sativus]
MTVLRLTDTRTSVFISVDNIHDGQQCLFGVPFLPPILFLRVLRTTRRDGVTGLKANPLPDISPALRSAMFLLLRFISHLFAPCCVAGWGSLIPPTLDKELFFIFSSEMLGQCLCSAAELALGLYCSASSSSGDPGPLPVASVEAVWSHPRN